MTSAQIDPLYLETFFEVTVWIAAEMKRENSLANQVMDRQGSNGHYELAADLADKFELLHAGRVWDGEFLETLWIFLDREASLAMNPSYGDNTNVEAIGPTGTVNVITGYDETGL